LGALPVFERDRLLLRVRALTFGPDLGAFSTCPSCAAPVEFTAPVAPMTEQAEGEATIAWIEEGRELRLRPASTLDLLASLEVAEESAAEAIVLSRCLRVDGAPVEPGEVAQWPSARAQFNQWHEAMARSFALTCPQCSESFTIPLDVPRFLWREVRHEARRLFDDVHVLAAHYGWAERDILKMNRARRAAYLERVPS
ncbi:MAG TPA: hypothetical protein VK762_28895, partial [Polyangiaceae bacterium]|nr:hypothetical protein [Polyangiaceae bacterium]